jgi:hypothetical protein
MIGSAAGKQKARKLAFLPRQLPNQIPPKQPRTKSNEKAYTFLPRTILQCKQMETNAKSTIPERRYEAAPTVGSAARCSVMEGSCRK